MRELLRSREIPRAAAHGQDFQALWLPPRWQMQLAMADADGAGGIPGGLCSRGVPTVQGRIEWSIHYVVAAQPALCLRTHYISLYPTFELDFREL
jgi:hypothetical protein